MRKARVWAGVVALLCSTWAGAASADEEESWFDQDPDQARKEESAEESDDTSQEEGEVDPESTRATRWLTRGSVALTAGLHLGMGGTASVDIPGPLDVEDDLVATVGLQLGGEYVLLDYLALGGELRLSGVNTKGADDSDIGRDLLTDLVVKPRGRYVFESIGLEAFAQLPFGVSIPKINDKKGGDASVGFTLGAGLGALYLFSEHWGISSDFTWLFHWYGVEQTNLSNNDKVDSTVKLSQFTWFINAVYAL
jgi:hypothetical protein